MFNRLLCLTVLLRLTSARYTVVPKFYGEDSAVIVDAHKPLPPMPPQFQQSFFDNPPKHAQDYPTYQIIPTTSATRATGQQQQQRQQQQQLRKNAKSKKLTIPSNAQSFQAKFFTQDEFPRELLQIAREKLGLRSLDEIPSLSELSELLGTRSAEETIAFIKQLTATEQGIALIKAYIESSDYTDVTGSQNNDNNDDYEDAIYEDNNAMPNSAENFGLPNEETTSTTKTASNVESKNNQSFFERLTSFLNIYNVQPQHRNIMETEVKRFAHQQRQNKPVIEADSKVVKPTRLVFKPNLSRSLNASKLLNYPPIRMNPLPFHYPIPLRPIPITQPRRHHYNHQVNHQRNLTQSSYGQNNFPKFLLPLLQQQQEQQQSHAMHLNSPKVSVALPPPPPPPPPPHIQQLARIANISAQQLQQFIHGKPKLADLAVKFSRYPLGYDHSGLANGQLLAALQHAMENDDDLKKLLNSSDTLK